MVSTDPRQVILSVVVGIVIGKNVQDFRVHINQRLLQRETKETETHHHEPSAQRENVCRRSVFEQNRVNSSWKAIRLQEVNQTDSGVRLVLGVFSPM